LQEKRPFPPGSQEQRDWQHAPVAKKDRIAWHPSVALPGAVSIGSGPDAAARRLRVEGARLEIALAVCDGVLQISITVAKPTT
jgi:hypothetical protein